MSQKFLRLTEAQHQVKGYGLMVIGTTERIPGRRSYYKAKVHDQLLMGPFTSRAAAEDAAIAYWHEHHSGASLAKRFKDRTRGGFPVQFKHQSANCIVAAVESEHGWGQTSFLPDGRCLLSDQEDWDLIPITQ